MTTAQETSISTWTIDPVHSNVDFAVKHLMISTVRGQFRQFEATLYIDEANPENSRVEGSVDIASIDTGEPDRDAHLRSDDFFNAERFPKMSFRSKRLQMKGADEFKLTGDLTIRDVTREIELEGEFEGRVKDPWGNERIGLSAEGSISREEFGVHWNQALETGGWVVGDKVKISLHVAAVRQP